jgi:MmyB-like transcription regulator ligand binding domain
MDRYGNVLMTNKAAPRFFNRFIDMSQRKGPRNMLHLVFDPDGMRPFVEHWDEVASSLLYRVRTEANGRVVDEKTRELVAALLAYPGGKTLSAQQTQTRSRRSDLGQTFENNSATGGPVLPIIPLTAYCLPLAAHRCPCSAHDSPKAPALS